MLIKLRLVGRGRFEEGEDLINSLVGWSVGWFVCWSMCAFDDVEIEIDGSRMYRDGGVGGGREKKGYQARRLNQRRAVLSI